MGGKLSKTTVYTSESRGGEVFYYFSLIGFMAILLGFFQSFTCANCMKVIEIGHWEMS